MVSVEELIQLSRGAEQSSFKPFDFTFVRVPADEAASAATMLKE